MERKIGAKRKRTTTKKTTSHKRRRSVSGFNKGGAMDLIAVAGGAIGGRFLGNMITKFFPGTNLYLVNGAVAAGGYFAPKLVKAPWARMAGYGMIAGAAIGTAANLGIISGIGAGNRVMAYNLRNKSRVNGLDNLSAVNGLDNLSAVNGRQPMRRVAGVPSSNVYHTAAVLPVVEKLWAQKYGVAG